MDVKMDVGAKSSNLGKKSGSIGLFFFAGERLKYICEEKRHWKRKS